MLGGQQSDRVASPITSLIFSEDNLLCAHGSTISGNGMNRVFNSNIVDAEIVQNLIIAATVDGRVFIGDEEIEGTYSNNGGYQVLGVTPQIDRIATGLNGLIRIYHLNGNQSDEIFDNVQPLYNDIQWRTFEQLVTCNSNGMICLHDLRNKDEIVRFADNHGAKPTCVAVNPSQPFSIATGHDNGLITLWDLRKNTLPVHSMPVHKSRGTQSSLILVNSVKFRLKYQHEIFSCSEDATVGCWSTNGDLQNVSSFKNSDDYLGLNDFEFHPELDLLYCGGDSGKITKHQLK